MISIVIVTLTYKTIRGLFYGVAEIIVLSTLITTTFRVIKNGNILVFNCFTFHF